MQSLQDSLTSEKEQNLDVLISLERNMDSVVHALHLPLRGTGTRESGSSEGRGDYWEKILGPTLQTQRSLRSLVSEQRRARAIRRSNSLIQ